MCKLPSVRVNVVRFCTIVAVLFFLSNFYLRSEQDGETLKRQHRAASEAAFVGGERIVRKLRANEIVRERLKELG